MTIADHGYLVLALPLIRSWTWVQCCTSRKVVMICTNFLSSRGFVKFLSISFRMASDPSQVQKSETIKRENYPYLILSAPIDHFIDWHPEEIRAKADWIFSFGASVFGYMEFERDHFVVVGLLLLLVMIEIIQLPLGHDHLNEAWNGMDSLSGRLAAWLVTTMMNFIFGS